MPKVKVLKNTVASGKSLSAGKTAEVSERDARVLCAFGLAEEPGKSSKGGDGKTSASTDKTETR